MRVALPNGIVLIVQENHANTTVAVSANLKAGRGYEPAGKRGLADMVANLLDRGTASRSSNQIAAELEGAAAEITTGTGWETVGVHGKALSGDTALLLRNIADLLRHPTFPAEEVEKMREQMLSSLAMERDQPNANARRAFYRAVLPEGHPYRLASFAEEEAGLRALTREDLLAFHQAQYSPQSMVISVVGDVDAQAVQALVEQYFGDWQGAPPAPLAADTVTPGAAERVVTPLPEKPQANIYVGHAGGLRRTDSDYYAATIMNLILGGGGALNSRLGEVIRDQHGLAYSVYSDFHASTNAGPWYALLGVNPQNVDKAVDLLQREIARMREQGVTEEEVRDAVAYLTGAYAITLETNSALANTLMDAEYFDLGLDYPERVREHYGRVTRAQVNAAAKKYLHPDRLTISIAGSYGAQAGDAQ
jgi:zinc protease